MSSQAKPSEEVARLIDLIENKAELETLEIKNIINGMKTSEINMVYENDDGSFYTIFDKAYAIAKKRIAGSVQERIARYILKKRGLTAKEMLEGKGEGNEYRNVNGPTVRTSGIADVGRVRVPVRMGGKRLRTRSNRRKTRRVRR